MAEFYTVRHGQASFGADDYDKLSPLGWRQARWLGEHWREVGVAFDRILCGDLLRHRETAQGICEGLEMDGSRVRLAPQLNEFDFHSVLQCYGERDPQSVPPPGTGRSEFYRFLKKAMLAWAAGEIHPLERWCDFERRIEDALELIADAPKGSKTLVVSSGGAIAMLVCRVLGGSVETVTRLNLQIKNTAVSRFFSGADGIALHSFNHVPHLEREGRRKFITYS
ncbi:histidine phosphatase family protein [Microbulbifer thermotolerans]|uniref:histidine phosphatase family protein n=1 Tax=Microbulbifer thermotolerans TaxID=252514 RepID=UPI0026726828|nr:histidine phosphatase family protein [Microbulbifer thermotolerans]WKT59440.1 histidine phosphatase family protein [Microbulbifer thermotolerans]